MLWEPPFFRDIASIPEQQLEGVCMVGEFLGGMQRAPRPGFSPPGFSLQASRLWLLAYDTSPLTSLCPGALAWRTVAGCSDLIMASPDSPLPHHYLTRTSPWPCPHPAAIRQAHVQTPKRKHVCMHTVRE